MKTVQGNVVPSFTTKDLVAGQITCEEDKDQKEVICSAYVPSGSMEMPPPTEFKELVRKHPKVAKSLNCIFLQNVVNPYYCFILQFMKNGKTFFDT